MKHHERKPPVLRLVRGGLADPPPAPDVDDWTAFEQSLGWQPSDDNALPANYEEMLVGRIFGDPLPQASDVVVPIGPPAKPAASPAKTQWVLLALAVAVAAAVVLAWPQPAPPAASLPTAVPERAPVRSAEPDKTQEPVEEPAPPPEVDDPGAPEDRYAKQPRPWPVQRPVVAPPLTAPPVEPAATVVLAAAPEADPVSPDPDPDSAPLPVPDLLALAPPVPLSLPATNAGWAADDAPAVPMWTHLGMSSAPSDARAVALVDVIDAGRQLRGL